MNAINRNRTLAGKAILLVALCGLFLSAATPVWAQFGWAVGNKATLLYTPDGTDNKAWTIQSAPADTDNLNCVWGLDASNAWAVGNKNLPKRPNGTIIYFDGTLNKGNQVWTLQDSKAPVNLNGVYFADKTHGWVVGDNGTILYSNGTNGSQWVAQTSGTKANLYGVFFYKATNGYYGWAVGDAGTALFYTPKGGWQKATAPAAKGAVRSVRYDINPFKINDSLAVAVGDGDVGVWTSTNGQTWAKMKTQPKGAGDLKQVRIVATIPQNGQYRRSLWVAGQGLDDVFNWNGLGWLNKSTIGFDVYGLSLTDGGDNVWVVGQTGDIDFTPEGNKVKPDWIAENNPRPDNQQLNSIVMLRKQGQQLTLDQQTAPASGTAGISYVSIAGSGFPQGNFNPANVTIQLSTSCEATASVVTSAVGIVSDSGDRKLISFVLPSGLASGKYFVTVSDLEHGDASFESGNCAETNVSQ
jgi:hypothetical protein